MTSTLELHKLSFSSTKTYFVAALFIIGNLLLPQLCHLLPLGGPVLLPIYFFTLVGAYKYGWKVGLLTVIASPVLNYLLFSMPALAVLPAILLKSTVLAIIAGFFASKFNKASLLAIVSVVLGYQIIGTLGEWLLCGDFFIAVSDFRIGLPGMLLQIFGGWIVINKVLRK